MAFQVELRSREQIMGDLVRVILANTDLNDVAAGSDLSVLLEAISSVMFQVSLGSLKILENTNLESLVGNALDKKAESIRIPNTIGGVGRIPASQSSGVVTIGSPFTKVSTKFYAGKPAPFAGSKTLYLENGYGLKYKSDGSLVTSKKLYIGRGTADRYEGPIEYTNIQNQGSFWVVTLAKPLTKNHLYGDIIVLAQGGDRIISAGMAVQTVTSSELPSIVFSTTSSTIIPDGESEADVSVICTKFGESGNALAGSIIVLPNPPFVGATVTNKTVFKNGRSTESDESLRNRIKNYPATLSRGTKIAIQAAIKGLTDPETGKTITSSVVVDPSEQGDSSKVYIDDGSGLEPTYDVQPYELLLKAASGQETTFQTAQFPVAPATAIGAESGPFVLVANEELVVIVDGISETYRVTAKNYNNLNAVTAYEIVRDFNSQSNIVGFRTFDGGKRVVLVDLSGSAETLLVQNGTVQEKLGFPVSVIRPIFLYENSVLKSFKGSTATLITNPFSSWNPTAGDFVDNLFVVDGVPQSVTIASSDFAEYDTDITSATITQWSQVFAKKVAGCKFSVAGNVMICTSRQATSENGTLEVPEKKADGSDAGWIGDAKMWKPLNNGGILYSSGSTKDFKFNRFTGEIRFINKPPVNSTIEIGTRETRASIESFSTPTGLFTLSPLTGTVGNARFVVGFDGDFTIRATGISIGDSFSPIIPDPVNASNIIRITATSEYLLKNAQVGDYIYLIKNESINSSWGSSIEGIYLIKALGNNFSPNALTYPSVLTSVTSGSDVVTITMIDHGFSDGARITISATSAINGISAIDLSQVLAPITIINNNKFSYVAGAVSPSNSPFPETTVAGYLDSIQYDADCWAEFEISSEQQTSWAPLLGFPQNLDTESVSIFKSARAIPQIVDFGPIGVIDVDDIISSINSQIVGGKAYKISGSKFKISSNDWSNSGTIGMLSVISTATTLFNESINSSMQSHTAYSSSGYVQGSTPVAKIKNQNEDTPTSASIIFEKDLIDITTSGLDPSIESNSLITEYPEGFESIWLTGKQFALSGRVYNNQTSTPYSGFMRSRDAIHPLQTSDTAQTLANNLNRYANYSIRLRDLPIAFEDKVVVEMDLDPINKTVSIPLYKKAQIQDIDAVTGSGKGSVISFRLRDPEDLYAPDPINFPLVLIGRPFFHNESAYKSFDFSDFKLLTKSVGLYREVTTPALASCGQLTAIEANQLFGIKDGDTFTINDGTTSVVFEFDSDSSVVGLNVPVLFNAGLAATGSVTTIAMLPGVLLDEVDTFVLNDGVNAPVTFEFDSDGIYVAGRVPVTYVHGNKSYGSLTAWLADPLNGVKDGDTFTIGATTFEFDDNASVISGNIAVPILSIYNSSLVRSSMISSINGASIGATASPAAGDMIDINADDYGPAWDLVITENITNLFVTLYPVSMTGGIDNATDVTIATAIMTAINGASNLNITASVLLNVVNLSNDYSGTSGNQIISESVASGSSLTPIGMSGGTADSNAATIKAAMLSSINGVSGFSVKAYYGIANQITLSNEVVGSLGNQPIIESISNSATLSPVGMAGGSDLSASTPRSLILRSAAYGGTSKLSLKIVLPTEPSQSDMAISHINDFIDGTARCNIILTLASKSVIFGSVINSGTYTISCVPSGNLFLLTFTSPFLNPAGQYQTGNVLRVGGSGQISGAYYITSATIGQVSVLSPTNNGITSLLSFNANQFPLMSYPTEDKKFTDIATVINSYYSANPIASAEAIGVYTTNYVKLPSYISHTASTPYTGSVMSEALVHHGFDCHFAGSAGIWLYDSSDENLNNIKATAQSIDAVFPTISEAAGTTYSPIGEDVVIVPTNSKTVQNWLNFNAVSSLTILAETMVVNSAKNIQIGSREDGSLGAVKVTGVTGNALSTFVIGNGTDDDFSSKIKILSADAKSLMRNQLVKIENNVASEILRPYRKVPSVDELTTHNTININTFFRQTNSIKYIRKNLNSARIIFYRFGQGEGQSEPLSIGNAIDITPLGNSIVKIQATDIGVELAARVGDMMYIRPTNAGMSYTSPFLLEAQCKGLSSSTGTTDPNTVEYLGYPVIKVIDDQTIHIIAPNITTPDSVVLVSDTDLVFIPAIYNEKNIKTNKDAGSKFENVINSGNLYYFIKTLGGNLISLWVSNSPDEATDTMFLDDLCVNTDDYITIGNGFDAANKGTFKIIGTNGRNHIIFYNENGGKDEILDTKTLSLGGRGQRNWKVGPIKEAGRSIRIIDSESVKTGDRIRISTPAILTSPWFSSLFFGSWNITGIGYIGITEAYGTLIPVAADNVGIGIRHADTFTVGDGAKVLVFEFSTNGSVSNPTNIRIDISPVMSATNVGNAIVNTINSLGSSFSISADMNLGVITLTNRRMDGTVDFIANNQPNSINYTIVENTVVATLSPVGMIGAAPNDGAIAPYIDIIMPNAPADVTDPYTGYPMNKFQISGNDSSVGFVEKNPFNGYRLIGGHSINPQYIEESDVFLVPKISTSKMSDTFGTQLTGMFKLDFKQRAFQGIDGYKVYAGLVREAHRIIDGLPTNPILYPGTKAMGAPVEVLPPLVKTVKINMQVRPKDGVTINSISEIIKSTVASYINRLGVGKPVIISEIIRVVQGLPGVYSVTVTSTIPTATDDRIVVGDMEVMLVLDTDTDITVG